MNTTKLNHLLSIVALTCCLIALSTCNGFAADVTHNEFDSVEERRVFALMEQERLQLQEDRKDLAMRENELKTLEASVDKKITEIDNRLKELKSLQGKIETLLAEKTNTEKKRIKDLSTIYEKMAPGRAALAINNMDPALATDLLASMKPKAAAKILDMLDKQKTSTLSTTFTRIQIEGENMETMIVSPAPGPKPFKPKSNIENQSASESTFAPTLDQAINNKKSSTTPPSQDSKSPRTVKADKELQDKSSDTVSDEGTETQTYGAIRFISNTDPAEPIPAEVSNLSGVAKEAAATFKNGESIFSFMQKGAGNVIARQDVSSEVKSSQIDKELPRNTQGQRESIPASQLSAKSSNESIVTAQFAQTLSSTSVITKEHIAAELSQKPGNTVSLHNNDTISWNQTKSAESNMLSQNTTLLQFTSEDSQDNISPAIRVERFTTPPELSAKNVSENGDKIPPLSAERIAAKLTDIPLQANHTPTSLRDNVSSLRQDTHEQFIDAKLDYIDKKQHTQADQQSLNSDSDSAQKNSLTASPKNIDKTNETSFSQSLHTISTDKPTSSGIDPLRPGGSVFTPQIQEGNILHQVLHKFRISQHLQDSRLVMKLHPAELGDLKIDVQLKDGTINANILAQTQQVQDILEKNMPRLKALMEEQGLIVNEIAIKLDTDVSDNKNMFEDHLAQDEKSFTKRKDISSSVQFELDQEIIEEAELSSQPSPSGVNVMI
jgi:flagellar motility protein MotE (MotC chaperone)/flagellar hook-length control protein FliK